MLGELLKQERKRKRKRHTNPLSQINKEIRLEAYTEQSESNPGRSLGIINKEGTAVWKTVPTDYQKPITDNRQPKVYYGSLKDIKIIAKHCITVA